MTAVFSVPLTLPSPHRGEGSAEVISESFLTPAYTNGLPVAAPGRSGSWSDIIR